MERNLPNRTMRLTPPAKRTPKLMRSPQTRAHPPRARVDHERHTTLDFGFRDRHNRTPPRHLVCRDLTSSRRSCDGKQRSGERRDAEREAHGDAHLAEEAVR